jgi:hypothetical protein
VDISFAVLFCKFTFIFGILLSWSSVVSQCLSWTYREFGLLLNILYSAYWICFNFVPVYNVLCHCYRVRFWWYKVIYNLNNTRFLLFLTVGNFLNHLICVARHGNVSINLKSTSHHLKSSFNIRIVFACSFVTFWTDYFCFWCSFSWFFSCSTDPTYSNVLWRHLVTFDFVELLRFHSGDFPTKLDLRNITVDKERWCVYLGYRYKAW